MLFRAAFRNVLRSPRRTLTVLTVMTFGVVFLGLFRGFNGGLLDTVKDSAIHARYGHGQIDEKGYLERVYEKPWDHWIRDYAPLEKALAASGVPLQLFPRVTFAAMLTNEKTNIAAVGQGVNGAAEAGFFRLLHVDQGKTLEGEENGVLLGSGLAKALDRKVGDRVTVLTNTLQGSLNGVDLTVTGIFTTGAADLDEGLFRMQLATAQSLLETDRVEAVSVGLAHEGDWPKVADLVARDFPALEATPFNVIDKVNYQQFVDWLKSQFGAVQFVVLLIVLLAIFNNVSTGILERKQEIGCLKANGEAASDVLGLVTLEAAILAVSGAVLGAVILIAIIHGALRHGFTMPPTPGVTRATQMVLNLPPRALFEVCVGPAAVAVIAAILAGLRVARMPIAEALRAS
ncbi:MAG TPA: FtsX-like permease family protein [Polyangiaceae bacterium]